MAHLCMVLMMWATGAAGGKVPCTVISMVMWQAARGALWPTRVKTWKHAKMQASSRTAEEGMEQRCLSVT